MINDSYFMNQLLLNETFKSKLEDKVGLPNPSFLQNDEILVEDPDDLE